MAVNPLRALNVNAQLTPVSNEGDDVQTLMSATLAAGSLTESGFGIHIIAWGVVANNANLKQLSLDFGSASKAFALQASVASAWKLDAWIFSTGTATQVGISRMSHGVLAANTNDVMSITATENSLNPIVVGLTADGEQGSDITVNGMVVFT